MIASQLRTFFVTAVTHQRQPLFRREMVAELFLETLFHYRDKEVFLIHEFVIMPDHVHLILTPFTRFSLEKAIQRIKGGFSFQAGKQVSSQMEVWQRSFTHHLILDVEDLQRHRDYVLDNPVRARLARTREDYPLSSAHRFFGMDALPDYFRG
jgi:REP-associated tyrosine transposase